MMFYPPLKKFLSEVHTFIKIVYCVLGPRFLFFYTHVKVRCVPFCQRFILNFFDFFTPSINIEYNFPKR